jgi:hypothetical protein
MNKSTILTVCLSIAVGFILASALNRSSAGQQPPPETVGREGQVWRYQLLQASDNSYVRVYLNDTVTGRVWAHGMKSDDKWLAFESPAASPSDRVPR